MQNLSVCFPEILLILSAHRQHKSYLFIIQNSAAARRYSPGRIYHKPPARFALLCWCRVPCCARSPRSACGRTGSPTWTTTCRTTGLISTVTHFTINLILHFTINLFTQIMDGFLKSLKKDEFLNTSVFYAINIQFY